MTFIEKINILLTARGISASAIEPIAGLPTNRVSKWRNGTGEPTLKQGLRLARYFGVPLEYLADDDLEDPAAAHPLLSEDERTLLALYRELPLKLGDWMRRVMQPPSGSGPARTIAQRDETEADQRRHPPHEHRAPNGSEVEPEGDDKGSKPPRRPKRPRS